MDMYHGAWPHGRNNPYSFLGGRVVVIQQRTGVCFGSPSSYFWGGGSVNENCSLVPSRFGVSLVCYGGSCNLVVLVGLFTTCAYFACCPQLACCPTNILHAFLNLRAIVSSRGFLVFYLLEAVLVWHNAFIILLWCGLYVMYTWLHPLAL